MKKISDIVRYQNVWNDYLFSKDFNALDAVYKYNYTDQAHMLNHFKKHHGMTMRDAKAFALRHFPSDVDFLQ